MQLCIKPTLLVEWHYISAERLMSFKTSNGSYVLIKSNCRYALKVNYGVIYSK